jgi:hypothetical protein
VRIAAIFGIVFLLTACGGGSTQHGGTLAKTQYLSALEVIPAPIKNGSTGAPMMGLVVSGTLTNGGKAPMICSRDAFVLVHGSDGDITPAAQFCTAQEIAPQQSTYFNATFAAPPRDDWQLRFEHGDGSYEVHDLAVPPG